MRLCAYIHIRINLMCLNIYNNLLFTSVPISKKISFAPYFHTLWHFELVFCKLMFWKLYSHLHFNYFEYLGLKALINWSARTFGLAWRGSDRLKMGLWKKLLVLRGPHPAYVSLWGVWIKQQEPKEFSRCSEVEVIAMGWGSGEQFCGETTWNSHNNPITPIMRLIIRLIQR